MPATRMEAGNSLATASRLIAGNTLLVTGVDLREERGMPASTAAAAAVAGRRSAWATAAAIPMLVQRTYSSCSNSQEKINRKQVLAHADLCCDS